VYDIFECIFNLLLLFDADFCPFILETKEVKSLEEKKTGVKGIGRKTTDESEYFAWRDDVKVPCGKLVPSGNKDGPLEYSEFAVYDPKQVDH
jgi:hypothetical protein